MSSTRNILVRSMHDLGLAAWFGGSLMGAVGLNGATRNVVASQDDIAIAASGWARWTPIAAAGVGVHLVGGVGLILANRGRIVAQEGADTNTAIKSILTVAAIATTAYSGILGAHLATDNNNTPVDSATVPAETTPARIARSQQQLRILQWVTPALTGALIVLAAEQGEQQKPAEIARGVASKVLKRSRS